MIIEKVFSNIEEESEKLYSILLSEDETALFSEFQKEFNSKAQKELRRKFDTEHAGKLGNNIRSKVFIGRHKNQDSRYDDPLYFKQKFPDMAKTRGLNKLHFKKDQKMREEQFKKHLESSDSIFKDSTRKAKELRDLKNKRIIGKTALGVAGVTGAAIIGKKLLDKKKKENK